MSHVMIRPSRSAVISACVLALLAGAGCTGSGGDSGTGILGGLLNAARRNLIMVRVVNETTSNMEVELRVDGATKILPICTALQRTCDYVLTTCPGLIEVVQETRLDDDENFTGGRNFEGNPDFTFTSGEFECGDTLILQFSDTQASAQAI